MWPFEQENFQEGFNHGFTLLGYMLNLRRHNYYYEEKIYQNKVRCSTGREK